MRLILGSASPRRRELLAQIGITPDDVVSADIDETPKKGEEPRPYCARMAREKVAVIAPDFPDDLILCADTTVALGRRILGKPENADDAARMLHLIMGRRHRVVTSVALGRGGRLWQRDVETAVRMKRLSTRELGDYLDSGEWRGKAGAYGIQGRAGALIPWINGSFSAVVGLPLAETANLLLTAGYRPERAT
ncbi:MAG: Maf family protein [Paracoccaceae bacterium]